MPCAAGLHVACLLTRT
ncbi:hypothetical protein JMJ77_0013850, partial [Colletotrichum scovillei]